MRAGCIVHTISHEGDLQAFGLQAGDLVGFVAGENISQDAFDPELVGDRRGSPVVVSGDHRHVDPQRMKAFNG